MKLSERLSKSMGLKGESFTIIIDLILKFAFRKKLKKGAYLFEFGKVEEELAYVEQGLLRKFTQDGEKEHVNWFSMEGDFILIPKSFLRGEENTEAVQALEDCVLYTMKKSTLVKLMELNNHIGQLVVKEIMEYICDLQKICVFLRTKDALERYLYLEEFNPILFRRLSQKQLATFLGIDTTYLSKIKKEATILERGR
ncbi:MAG: hypothetical protein RI995_1081 [Bacteroidota bacterium]|jgi:CRP-like cAMP-binding protein